MPQTAPRYTGTGATVQQLSGALMGTKNRPDVTPAEIEEARTALVAARVDAAIRKALSGHPELSRAHRELIAARARTALGLD